MAIKRSGEFCRLGNTHEESEQYKYEVVVPEQKLPKLGLKGEPQRVTQSCLCSFSSFENVYCPADCWRANCYIMAHVPCTEGRWQTRRGKCVEGNALCYVSQLESRNETDKKSVFFLFFFLVGHEGLFLRFLKSLNFYFQDELACGWDPFTTYFCQLKYKLVSKRHLHTWLSFTNVFRIFIKYFKDAFILCYLLRCQGLRQYRKEEIKDSWQLSPA